VTSAASGAAAASRSKTRFDWTPPRKRRKRAWAAALGTPSAARLTLRKVRASSIDWTGREATPPDGRSISYIVTASGARRPRDVVDALAVDLRSAAKPFSKSAARALASPAVRSAARSSAFVS
jgi:hypothetical protein